jgi:hypothetical protein
MSTTLDIAKSAAKRFCMRCPRHHQLGGEEDLIQTAALAVCELLQKNPSAPHQYQYRAAYFALLQVLFRARNARVHSITGQHYQLDDGTYTEQPCHKRLAEEELEARQFARNAIKAYLAAVVAKAGRAPGEKHAELVMWMLAGLPQDEARRKVGLHPQTISNQRRAAFRFLRLRAMVDSPTREILGA